MSNSKIEQVQVALHRLSYYIGTMNDKEFELFKAGRPVYGAFLPDEDAFELVSDGYRPNPNIRLSRLEVRMS